MKRHRSPIPVVPKKSSSNLTIAERRKMLKQMIKNMVNPRQQRTSRRQSTSRRLRKIRSVSPENDDQ